MSVRGFSCRSNQSRQHGQGSSGNLVSSFGNLSSRITVRVKSETWPRVQHDVVEISVLSFEQHVVLSVWLSGTHVGGSGPM